MTVSWYSFSVNPQSGGSAVFSAYFSVDDSTSLITGFYDLSLPTGNFYTDVLLPTNDAASFNGSTNTYPITGQGTNIYSTALQNYFSASQNHFNIYLDYNSPNIIFYSDAEGSIDLLNPPYTVVINSISDPLSNICFPAGTPIKCDQGNIPIEKINSDINTIRGKKIVGITKTITQDNYLVCFEKDSLGTNIPSQKTIISKNHCIFLKGKMIKAKEFFGTNDKIYKISYRGEVLYNVLMEDHNKMLVNNLICETLHPENRIAKLYKYIQNCDLKEQKKLIKEYNDYIIRNKIFNPKKH